MSELARTITDDHARAILLPRGIHPDKIAKLGVYSVTTPDELPEVFAGGRYVTIPGLVFTWHSPTGGDVLQYRPDEPIRSEGGDPVKYVFPGGSQMVLNRIRDKKPYDGPMLLAEGTMQSLAASLYTHPEWAVYGMSGCWSWRRGETQVAIPDLMVAEGRDVVIALDADAATNLNVYNAGLALKEALVAEGAATVQFLRLGGHGAKAGLDDVLGARPEDKRASYLARLIGSAKDTPADKPPKASRSGAKGGLTANRPAGAGAGRPMLVVNEDRHEVINQMTTVLRSRWDGTELFNYGGILARRKGASMEPVTDGVFADLISEAAQLVTVNAKGDATFAWPDENSRKATLSRADTFAPLERISRVPFVRADGSISQTSGYDPAAATFLVLDEVAERVQVPEHPTGEDVAAAVKLLCDEWLGDFMAIMPEACDRANALALVLTPLIRGLVPLAPLAVIDGLQMGVGKNLLADVISIFATGRAANPLPYSREDEENRKVITSTFRAGHELFVFDEAHVIEGPNLARAITGLTYSDRILGVSNMIEFPNRITWLALGNNVIVNGDLARRVYRIRLAPQAANPQDRDSDSFRHPDIKAWTAEHRPELLAAGLTLVRAWMAGEREESRAGRRFGSFEAWGGMVGGILEGAGIPDFLGNLVEWRSESDYETAYWTDHLRWLAAAFDAAEFTVGDVVTRMKRSNNVDHPPRLEDHTPATYNRSLGQAYGRVRNRVFSGLQLVRTATPSGHGNRWRVIDTEATDGGAGRDNPSPSPEPDPAPTAKGDVVLTADPATSATSATSNAPYTKDFRMRSTHTSSPQGTEIPIYPMYPMYPAAQGDPLATLLPLAASPAAPICPDCDQPEALTSSGFWYACPACSPSTFPGR